MHLWEYCQVSLRPYQIKAIEEIKKFYQQGIKRVLLHAATGSGKTVIFCTVLKSAAEKGTKTLVTVKGVKLVEQASERLTREGVTHGIIQGSNTQGIHHNTLVTSIDTLYARKLSPKADFIVIDEAHLSTGKAYEWFLAQYPNAFILAVSATPHLKKGLRHVADAIVYPISMRDLTAQGYLVPLRYFAPSVPDLSNVKVKSTGDYDERQLSNEMTKPKIKGDIVNTWQTLGENRPTILFCVTIEQSQQMISEFSAVNIPAAHIDASTPRDVRNQTIAALTSGEIKIVSNVGVLCTGVDIPPLSCIISARPTKSYNLWIQQLGRGTRPFPGKKDCLVLDHASNTMQHGFAEDEMIATLDPQPKKPRGKTNDGLSISLVRCMECYAIFAPAPTCPVCGAAIPERERKIIHEKKHALSEIRVLGWEFFLDSLINTARLKGYKKGFIYYKMKEKYGTDIANAAWPKIRALRKWETKERASTKT